MLALTEQALLKTTSYINGQWLASKAGVFQVVNPASDEVLATVSEAGETEAVFAVEAAAAAQPSWAVLPAAERAAILLRWQQLLQQHEADLALLLTLEQGKPLAEARAEIRYGAAYLSWFAEEAKRLYGDIIPPAASDKQILVLRQPLGVVTAITPWNFPNAMLMRKAAAALAAGCSFVVKPAAQTPLSALACAE
ncbi:MAG: succinate-semialdehyde dehydrogenase (NADP(+)), partial [Alishewanella sp. 34-51-39]